MPIRIPALYDSTLDAVIPGQPGDTIDPSFLAPASSHSTVLATCPASGPTIAPVSEGHYYWTSTIGEKWLWIYGDAAPFVTGKHYSETLSATSTYVYDGLASPVVRATFVAPRAGIVHFQGYSDWVNDVAEIGGFYFEVINQTTSSSILKTTSRASDQFDLPSSIVCSSVVATGDTVVFTGKIIGNFALVRTGVNEKFEIRYGA